MIGELHGWTVHDEHAGVLSYEYPFNDRGGTATTFAARIPGGELLVISPAAGMSDQAFAALGRFGEVSIIVAPNGHHHLGLPDWRRRFRHATFHAPKRAAKRIAKKNPLAPKLENLAAIGDRLGGQVYLRETPNTRTGELWAWVKTPQGNHWFGSDIFCNWQEFPGNFLLKTAWRLSNSGPGLSLFNLAMAATLKDRKGALRILLKDMEEHPPATLVMSHGTYLDYNHLSHDVIRLLHAAV